jgi:hypothetical protein
MTVTAIEATAPAREEYDRRREARRLLGERLMRRYQRLTAAWKNIRLLIAAVIWEEMNARLHTGVLALLFTLAVFMVVLLRWANRVQLAWRRSVRAAAYYERRLAVLDGQWAGLGEHGARYLDGNHPYAADLDLFGEASIYELLCTARTRAGQDTLADWLLRPASAEVIRARQAAVRALRDRLDFREDLEMIAGETPTGEERTALSAWAAQPHWPGLKGANVASVGPVGWFVITFIAWLVFGPVQLVGLMVLMWVAFAAAAYSKGRSARDSLAALEPFARTIAVYAEVLPRWHRELDEPAKTAEPFGQLSRRLGWLRIAPLGVPVLAVTRLALAVEDWRQRHGPMLSDWLLTVGRAECLCALATYAYENPDDPFPELVEPGAVFDGERLAHPLLPRGRCVPNDLRLGGDLRLLVVSGSNMSGKSTFLRTVGVNAVLALAGAPVRAARLRLSPLTIGATLRVQDSLARGQSRFFAEITRLRQILDMAKGPVPVLFLLDELLSGTNSDDRRAGAEAVLRRLVEAGALGLVTTHDLALTAIADQLAPAGVNVHFDERLEDGRLAFDYTLRPGVVRQRNALALMRAVGIEV